MQAEVEKGRIGQGGGQLRPGNNADLTHHLRPIALPDPHRNTAFSELRGEVCRAAKRSY
jgi:hypothetical protein